MINNPGVNKAIARQTDRQTLVIGATEGASVGLDVRAAAGLQMITGAETGTLTVYAFDQLEGTYLPLVDADGNAVTITIAADTVYDLPEALFSCHFVKFVTDGVAFTATMLAKG
jgi:hypothetical protein